MIKVLLFIITSSGAATGNLYSHIKNTASNVLPEIHSQILMSSIWTSNWFITSAIISLFAFLLFIINSPQKYRNQKSEQSFQKLTNDIQQKDIELKKVREDLIATQNQLIESEKMASLGQLTAGIAHEIQNPLNFVNNFSELSAELLDELNGSPPDEQISIVNDLKQNLQKIAFHGKRADSIVKGMLQHSRTGPAEKEPTDINKLVEEFFVLAYHGMRAKDPGFNCLMDKHLSPGLPMIKIIPQDVSRVILNIFNNSFYAVDEKSKSEDKNYRPTVSITTKRTNGDIVLKIRDNGKGIPLEIQEKIFNPFFTTKPVGQGTGLGLSISHEIIVKKHQGNLTLDSKQGEFTEFEITLPI